MNFANYQDFRTKTQTMIDGDDISTSDLSMTTLDLIIAAGERRIYREIRSSTQDTALSLSITNNAATLPADFIELRGAPYIGGFVPAIYEPWEVVQGAIQSGQASGSHPIIYTLQGDTMIFYPIQGTGTVTGRYYKQFADISTGLNALFNRHPDLFLYAALSESGVFLGETSRESAWEQKYASLATAANEEERRRMTRGSKLQTRVA